MISQTALKYEAQVNGEGHVEVTVPLPAGTHVTVFVVTEDTRTEDELLATAESSLNFWDNPQDDQDWNNA